VNKTLYADVDYDEAFRFLKSKRWYAFPNPGFQRQLSKLFDRRSLVELLDKIGANNEYKKTMKLQDHMSFNSWRSDIESGKGKNSESSKELLLSKDGPGRSHDGDSYAYTRQPGKTE